jgi:hypothetical protein
LPRLRLKIELLGGSRLNATLIKAAMKKSADAIKQKILCGIAAAITENDWETSYDLVQLTQSIDDPEARADVLNKLLVMPGHKHHQAVTMEIQKLRSPSSVPYIRQVLSNGFRMFEYTCSEPRVIAKWFSHALASINTAQSIALIAEFARASDPEIAKEMAYRLTRLNA